MPADGGIKRRHIDEAGTDDFINSHFSKRGRPIMPRPHHTSALCLLARRRAAARRLAFSRPLRAGLARRRAAGPTIIRRPCRHSMVSRRFSVPPWSASASAHEDFGQCRIAEGVCGRAFSNIQSTSSQGEAWRAAGASIRGILSCRHSAPSAGASRRSG